MASELSIGEVAARSGIAPSALRFYERQGLIAAARTGGNQRRYERSILRRLALLQAGRRAGIPLEDIRVALDSLPQGRTPTKRDWERLSRRWKDELDERIATLEALRGRLVGCIGCGCLSLRECRLINPDDTASDAGAGAQYLEHPPAPA
jgi:MerR family redox-sensitive transcriptional activator SoxR